MTGIGNARDKACIAVPRRRVLRKPPGSVIFRAISYGLLFRGKTRFFRETTGRAALCRALALYLFKDKTLVKKNKPFWRGVKRACGGRDAGNQRRTC